jgi:hypothetical protein
MLYYEFNNLIISIFHHYLYKLLSTATTMPGHDHDWPLRPVQRTGSTLVDRNYKRMIKGTSPTKPKYNSAAKTHENRSSNSSEQQIKKKNIVLGKWCWVY